MLRARQRRGSAPGPSHWPSSCSRCWPRPSSCSTRSLRSAAASASASASAPLHLRSTPPALCPLGPDRSVPITPVAPQVYHELYVMPALNGLAIGCTALGLFSLVVRRPKPAAALLLCWVSWLVASLLAGGWAAADEVAGRLSAEELMDRGRDVYTTTDSRPPLRRPPPRPPIGSPPAAGEGYWAGGGEGRDGGRVCVGWGVPWVFFADRLCTGVQCCGRSGARPGPGRCCLRRSSSTSGSWSPLPPPPPDQITHPNQTHDHHQPAFAHLPAPPLQRARAPPARVTTGDDRLLLRSGQRPRSAIPTPRRPPPSGCATGACSPGHRLRSPPGPVAPRKPNTSRLRPAVLLCTY